jgi:AMIN domain
MNLQQAPLSAYVDDVRTGTHTGYDRITITFSNGLPGTVNLTPQNSATFASGGGQGGNVTIAGQAGILVTMNSADEHTAYSGPSDFKTGYAALAEARQIQDFEGYVQWALGLQHSACYRAFTLTNPTRLVIDIQNS